jgi:predicted nuclease with RNAse H fold
MCMQASTLCAPACNTHLQESQALSAVDHESVLYRSGIPVTTVRHVTKRCWRCSFRLVAVTRIHPTSMASISAKAEHLTQKALAIWKFFRANTVIVLCALVILTFVLGLLELRIRRLTAHSWALSTAVQFSVAWRIDPRVKHAS